MELNYSGSGNIEYNNNKYRFDLYKNEDYGSVMIKISVNKPLCSFIELPLDFDLINGEYDNGFKFTLINCKRGGVHSLFSEGRTVFEYFAKYMIEGIKYNNIESVKFDSIQYSLTDIIEWGQISGYLISDSFELSKNKNAEMIIYNNDEGIMIKYRVDHSMLPCVQSELLCSEIKLSQTGKIIIESSKIPQSLDSFMDIIKKIKELIELCTVKRISISSIVALSEECYDEYGEKRVPRPISILSFKGKATHKIQDPFLQYKWITLPELQQYNSFESFFKKYDLLIPIVESYAEILYSDHLSNIRLFLDIVQSLETYHSRFITNNLAEFKNRIDNVILCDCPEDNKAQYKQYLLANSRSYITLESRMADLLLAEFKTVFETGDIAIFDFPKVVAQTRNYYIHYDESIKERGHVLSPEELSLYNLALLTILDYYILLELGFDDITQIRMKLKERWGDVSTALSIQKASDEKHNTPKNDFNA